MQHFLRKPVLLITAFLISISAATATAQRNMDSLWKASQNPELPDTLRMQAMHEYAWEGYGYSQPDSAFYFAGLLYEFAENRKLTAWMAKALNVQGNTLVIRGQYLPAYTSFRRSLEISEVAGNKPEIAVALHRIGIIYYYQGDIPRAIDYYTRSLKIREEIEDKKGISATVNNLGIVYSEREMYPEALKYFTRSLEICQELNDKRGEASALNNIGLVYKATGEIDKAHAHYIESLQISESLNDKRDIAAALNNIGHIHELKGDAGKALESFNRSVEIKKSIGDKQGTATTLINIGHIYEGLRSYKTAVQICQEALMTAEEIGAMTDQQKACSCLYISYKGLNQQEKALFYHERMMLIKDSLQAEETSRMLQQMEFASQMLTDSLERAGEKERMKKAHLAEIDRKNKTRNLFILSSLLLLASAGALYARMHFIRKSRTAIAKEKEQAENLLLNILPKEIANELKSRGEAAPRKFENVSILFTDFQEFTRISAELSPEKLVSELNVCFREFDHICAKYKIEKIKTIGDAYMAAGGLPVYTSESTMNTILAALEMADYMKQRKLECTRIDQPCFEMRAGIHTGPVVAGIVGVRKWQYDIWGDTVNLASRMEQSGAVGKVNISKSTHDLVSNDNQFTFEFRGQLMVKGKGCTDMYFVERS